MLLFEFDQGDLFPTQLGWRASGDIDPEVMAAVRDHVLQLIGRPLFPIQWTGADGAHAGRGEPNRLVAMDASGQVVSVEVVSALDSVGLVDALARSGRTASLGWLDLAHLYPSGAAAFRRDWTAFREPLPPRPAAGPRLYVVTGQIADEVRPALAMLLDSGVEVLEIAQRELANGRRFIEVNEPYRGMVPAALQAEEHPFVLDHDEDIRRLGVAPETAEAEQEAIAADPQMRAIAEACGGETALVWHQLRKGVRHDAVLRADGVVALPDGQAFADPSEAAAVASGRTGVDGWAVWRVTDGGPTLAEARDEVTVVRPRRSRRH